MSRGQAKKAAPAPVPVTRQMTAHRARVVAAACYRAGVAAVALAEFEQLRDALKVPAAFATADEASGDTWGFYGDDEDDAVVVAVPEPPRALLPPMPRSFPEPADNAWTCPCGSDHAGDHVHAALAATLEWLPDDHDLLTPLLRADDALSAALCLRRWATALAFHWGMDGEAYSRATFEMWKRWHA